MLFAQGRPGVATAQQSCHFDCGDCGTYVIDGPGDGLPVELMVLSLSSAQTAGPAGDESRGAGDAAAEPEP